MVSHDVCLRQPDTCRRVVRAKRGNATENVPRSDRFPQPASDCFPPPKNSRYVKCDGMAKRAVDAVKNKELRIEPAMHEKTWYQWLGNSRDW